VDLNVTDQLMIICAAFVKYTYEKKWEHNEVVHQLFINFKYNLVRREVLYNILVEFGIHMKMISLTKCV